MSGTYKKLIQSRQSLPSKTAIRDILELDRFSELNLREWSAASINLDELEAVLYFHLEPERRKLRSQLIESLQKVKLYPHKIKNWIRLVDYQFCDEPLSCAGSLCSPGGGGRFNVGIGLTRELLVLGQLYISLKTLKLLTEKNFKWKVKGASMD
jgi:hypothetical protein